MEGEKKKRKNYPIINGYRKCSQCERIKTVDIFVKSKIMSNGIMSICKKCRNLNEELRRLKYREKNIVRQRESDKVRIGKRNDYHRERRIKMRKEVLLHYSDGKLLCSCCGENNFEFLALDHKKGNGNSHRRQIQIDIYRWIRKNNYPEGFQVLCHNCNMSFGCYGYCPHKK